MKPLLQERPRAFLSCSFDNGYALHRQFFAQLIESCGYEALLLEPVRSVSIPQKIQQAIANSSLLVAILFTTPSEFILNEIGMAYSLNKPIIIFKERSVMLGGIAQGITDFADFDIQEYWSIAPQLTRLLVDMAGQFTHNFTAPDVIIRKHVKSHIIVSQDFIENTTEISLLNLSDRLSEVNHGLLLYNEFEKNKAQNCLFEVQVLSPSITWKVLQWSTGNSINCRIQFDPPLHKGDTVTYMYHQKTPNYLPLTREQLNVLIQSGQYHLDQLLCEKHYTISTPTEYLDLRLTFPRFHRICKEHVVVMYYKADILLDEEVERIKQRNLFKREEFAGQTTLHLQVPYPKQFATYGVRWQPDE